MDNWKDWEIRFHTVEKSLGENTLIPFTMVSGVMVSEMMLDAYDDDYCRTHNLSKEEIQVISENYGKLRDLFESI
jgi:hypothetical protein